MGNIMKSGYQESKLTQTTENSRTDRSDLDKVTKQNHINEMREECNMDCKVQGKVQEVKCKEQIMMISPSIQYE